MNQQQYTLQIIFEITYITLLILFILWATRKGGEKNG